MQHKTETTAAQQREQLKELQKILVNQEQINLANNQWLKEMKSKEQVCCPQPVVQHPQRMDLSVMINPNITPNTNIASAQDFQQQGCRTTLVQETQTPAIDQQQDIGMTASSHANKTGSNESCATQEGTQDRTNSNESCATQEGIYPNEVSHILDYIDT